MTVHIIACLWVFTATFQDSTEGTWMEGTDLSRGELYLTSFYFAITTITTVGYGDISGSSKIEKIFCIFLMLTGTSIYAFTSGALAASLVTMDAENADYKT
jgi:cyclic nucleotide gated channel alpha 1